MPCSAESIELGFDVYPVRPSSDIFGDLHWHAVGFDRSGQRLRRHPGAAQGGCRAKDWLPCIKHATWTGFCHLVSAIWAWCTFFAAIALGYFS